MIQRLAFLTKTEEERVLQKPGKKQFDRSSSDVFNTNEQSVQMKKTGKKRIDKVIDNDILGIRERNFSNEVCFKLFHKN